MSDEKDLYRPQNIVRIMEDGSTRVGLEPWPRDLRELAMELWAFKFQRNIADTADYLNSLPGQVEDGIDMDLTGYDFDLIVQELEKRSISPKTLYAWKRSDDWEEVIDQRHRQLAPALYARVDQQMELASIKAVETLIDIMKNPKAPFQVRQKAADSILDRTGHTAWVRPSDDGKMAGPQRDYSEAIAGKTAEELLRLVTGGNE